MEKVVEQVCGMLPAEHVGLLHSHGSPAMTRISPDDKRQGIQMSANVDASQNILDTQTNKYFSTLRPRSSVLNMKYPLVWWHKYIPIVGMVGSNHDGMHALASSRQHIWYTTAIDQTESGAGLIRGWDDLRTYCTSIIIFIRQRIVYTCQSDTFCKCTSSEGILWSVHHDPRPLACSRRRHAEPCRGSFRTKLIYQTIMRSIKSQSLQRARVSYASKGMWPYVGWGQFEGSCGVGTTIRVRDAFHKCTPEPRNERRGKYVSARK